MDVNTLNESQKEERTLTMKLIRGVVLTLEVIAVLAISWNIAISREIYFNPKIGCQFEIPTGFSKSDKYAHQELEQYRMLLFPETMAPEEKKRRSRLDAVFHKELSQGLLTRPFFTLKSRSRNRPIKYEDFISQIDMLTRTQFEPLRLFRDIDTVKLLDYLIAKKLIVDYENYSAMMMWRVGMYSEEGYMLQYLRFYRYGLIVLCFYSDIDKIRDDIEDFFTIVTTMKLSKEMKPQMEESVKPFSRKMKVSPEEFASYIFDAFSEVIKFENEQADTFDRKTFFIEHGWDYDKKKFVTEIPFMYVFLIYQHCSEMFPKKSDEICKEFAILLRKNNLSYLLGGLKEYADT